MRNRRHNSRIVGREVLVLAETTADRLVGGGKGAVIAYNSGTAGQSGELHRPPGGNMGTAWEHRTIKGDSRGAHEMTVGLEGRHSDNCAGKRASGKRKQVQKKVNSILPPGFWSNKKIEGLSENSCSDGNTTSKNVAQDRVGLPAGVDLELRGP